MKIILSIVSDTHFCESPDLRYPGRGRTEREAKEDCCARNGIVPGMPAYIDIWGPQNAQRAEPPKGTKYDSEKLQWSLMPFDVLSEVVVVLMMGAKKYSPDNWKHVKPPVRYFDAAMRHILAWKAGEKTDSESGKSHLAHAICCLIFLLWNDQQETDTHAQETHDAVQKDGTSTRVAPRNDGSGTDAPEVVRLSIPREHREKTGFPPAGVGAG